MKLIKRIIEDQVVNNIVANKVILILRPRRVGKTVLNNQVIYRLEESYLLLNGEDFNTQELLSRRSVQHYKNLLARAKVLIIDEA